MLGSIAYPGTRYKLGLGHGHDMFGNSLSPWHSVNSFSIFQLQNPLEHLCSPCAFKLDRQENKETFHRHIDLLQKARAPKRIKRVPCFCAEV